MTDVQPGQVSTKPYLIRAIYEWCADHGFTPYLAVKVDANTHVPMGYVNKDGQIVLNLGMEAVHNLHMGNEMITFGGRFGGVAHEIAVPVGAVIGIYARENGRGLYFEAHESGPPSPPEGGEPSAPGRPHLRVVK